MSEEWLLAFYKECGREQTLAHQTINQTNNWGLTVATAVVVATMISSIKIDNPFGNFSVMYPTFATWYIIIFSWIILLRFFVRSCIAYINIHRWNLLMKNINLFFVAKLENRRSQKLYCLKLIRAFYFEWQSPISMRKTIWDNLKLMYLWIVIPVLALIVWGFIVLDIHDIAWGFGLLIFAVPTLLEIHWFVSYFPFWPAQNIIDEKCDISDICNWN